MRRGSFSFAVMVFIFVIGGLRIGAIEAQDESIKVGDMVELYDGGSAYVIRTPVLRIDKNGNLTVRYKSPFTNGITNATLPRKRFWKAGGKPNPVPNNEFNLGDKVEFYFRNTDQVGQGVVSSITTSGERYTIQYKARGRMTLPVSLKAEAIWKKGGKKKPLPEGYRAAESRPGSGRTASGKRAAPKPKPFRTWTSANGNFEIKARYKSTQGNSVELEKEDGSPLTVELARLSAADNQYVANIGKNDLTRRRITVKPVVPFANNRLTLTGGKWEFKHDASEAIEFSLPSKSVRLSQPIGFGASTRMRENFWMPIGPDEAENAGSRTDEFRFDQWTLAQDGARCFLIANGVFEQECIIQGMNFATSELEFSDIIDGHGIAISLDGSKVAFLQTSRDGTARGELIIKETGPEGAVLQRYPVKAFMDKSGYNPSAGIFMNDSVLVTIGNRIVAFDVDRGTGYSTTPFPKHVNLRDAAVSPNRKLIALLSDGGIFLFDVSRGKPVGVIPLENIGFGKIAFSNDGAKMLYCSPLYGGVKVFDLATGKLSKEIVSHGEHVTKSVAWLHPRFVLLDNKSLFDLELGVVIWRFKPQGSVFEPLFHMGGNTFISNDGNQNLTPVEIRLDRIEKAVEGFSLDDITVLKSGDDFRIELDTTFNRQDNDGIRDRFQTQMEQLRGITYDENSQNVFSCTVDTGTAKSATIRMSKDETQTVRYTPTTCTIELKVNGDLKWRRTRVNTFSGGTLVGEEGETPQQAVTRLCRPKAAFFQNARFPSRFILFPNGKDVLGESTVSKNGVADLD